MSIKDKKLKTYKRFSTMNTAIKYLDKKYKRDGWMKGEPYEDIYIHGIRTIVMYGLRVDPCTDKQYEYVDKLYEKYPNYNIRLS